MMLKAIVVAACLALPLSAFAAGDKKLSPQQEKMTHCNADAKTKALKGDERKAFMRECLSGDGSVAPGAKTAQQEKMVTCNADAKAKALKGDERKKFMATCLKG